MIRAEPDPLSSKLPVVAPRQKMEPRAFEILEKIKVIFAVKGFDRASMQDLAQAAGMSAGNFYRYFPSKDAIIEAMVEKDLDEVQRDFTEILHASDPMRTLRDKLQERIRNPDLCDGLIWAQIEAATSRSPEIAALQSRMQRRIADYLVAVFARIADISHQEAESRYAAHARLIMFFVKGMTIHCAGHGSEPQGDRDPALSALVMTLIEQQLNAIARAGSDFSTSGQIPETQF